MGKVLARKKLAKLVKQARENEQQQTANAAAAAAAEQKAVAEQKALQQASAITSNGRTKPLVNKNTTNQAVYTGSDDDLAMYINDMRNRRKRRGAPIGENKGVLGQPTTLGV